MSKISQMSEIYFNIITTKRQYYTESDVITKDFIRNESGIVGGLPFANRENICDFLDCGRYLRAITLPVDDNDFVVIRDTNGKYYTNKVILGARYDLSLVSTFKFLAKYGVYFSESDCIAIGFAAKNGYLDIAKYLISVGADVNARHCCAIKLACDNDHLAMLKYLVLVGANYRADDNYPIRITSIKSYLALVQYLLYVGADINIAIHYACLYNNLTSVQYLVRAGSDMIEPIRSAIIGGHLQIVLYLLSIGGNINMAKMIAIECNRPHIYNVVSTLSSQSTLPTLSTPSSNQIAYFD